MPLILFFRLRCSSDSIEEFDLSPPAASQWPAQRPFGFVRTVYQQFAAAAAAAVAASMPWQQLEKQPFYDFHETPSCMLLSCGCLMGTACPSGSFLQMSSPCSSSSNCRGKLPYQRPSEYMHVSCTAYVDRHQIWQSQHIRSHVGLVIRIMLFSYMLGFLLSRKAGLIITSNDASLHALFGFYSSWDGGQLLILMRA